MISGHRIRAAVATLECARGVPLPAEVFLINVMIHLLNSGAH